MVGDIASVVCKSTFNSFMEETGQFSPNLNESQSYFFHPSELLNLEKISQLFMSRQGKPIQCFVDENNCVKYKDTGTFMYHKNGDYVQLSEKEKMYYIDRGFIVQ